MCIDDIATRLDHGRLAGGTAIQRVTQVCISPFSSKSFSRDDGRWSQLEYPACLVAVAEMFLALL